MVLEIRKLVTIVEETVTEGGRTVRPALLIAAAGAVVRNPLAGEPFANDLSPLVDGLSGPLGELLGRRVVELLDGTVEAYGKGVIVGANGEVEHGSAVIHTLRFGDPFRNAAGGTALLPAAEKRGAMGATLDLALKHKDDHAVRSHHLTFEVRVPDAPRSDELVVFCVASNGGRPHARIGSGPGDDGPGR
ncbi:MAG TPA: amino acid synthesis family protein [Acidimicrobiia bacterium]|jgi:hypothetical protein